MLSVNIQKYELFPGIIVKQNVCIGEEHSKSWVVQPWRRVEPDLRSVAKFAEESFVILILRRFCQKFTLISIITDL